MEYSFSTPFELLRALNLFCVPDHHCFTMPSFCFDKRILDATLHIYLGKGMRKEE
jgi:hypothetical protein